MNQRTKILAVFFGAFIAYAIFSSTIYPNWIEPLLTLDQRIASKQKTLDKLNEIEDRVSKARFEYKAMVNRISTFEPSKLQNAVRVELNTLIDQHHLQEAKVTPSRISEDRKTKIKSMMITVTASGKLESVVSFMQDIVELPYLLRMGNVVIYPAGSSRRKKLKDIVNFRVPIELLILPKQRIVGLINEKDLKKPEMVIRHQGHDYSPIWKATPFLKFIPPVPLQVKAGKDVRMKKGQRRSLTPIVTGGDKPYKYEWSPPEGLSDPHNPKPKINSSEPFEQEFTLTVTDAEGKTASDTIMIVVEQRGVKPIPPVPTARDPRWPDRRNRQIVMSLLNWVGDKRVSELMVYNKRKKTTEYFGPGAEFDGGELVFVHQTGGLVRRSNGYFIYPIGNTIDQDLTIDQAGDYPELKQAYEYIKNTTENNEPSKQKTRNDANKTTTTKSTPVRQAGKNVNINASRTSPMNRRGQKTVNTKRNQSRSKKPIRSAGSVRTTGNIKKKVRP